MLLLFGAAHLKHCDPAKNIFLDNFDVSNLRVLLLRENNADPGGTYPRENE